LPHKIPLIKVNLKGEKIMPSCVDAWIIEWHKYKGSGPEKELYGYSIHMQSVKKYLGDLYARISRGAEVGLEVVFPGAGWGSVVEATHVRVARDSDLGRALIAEKSIRTHGNSRALNHFYGEIELLALMPYRTRHYVIDYIPLPEAQRHTRLRRERTKTYQL
jgi:hypothetical protein